MPDLQMGFSVPGGFHCRVQSKMAQQGDEAMSSSSKDDKVLRAIHSHANWLKAWREDNRGIGRDFISPRGKRHSFFGYSMEVEKRERALCKKIREIVTAENTVR